VPSWLRASGWPGDQLTNPPVVGGARGGRASRGRGTELRKHEWARAAGIPGTPRASGSSSPSRDSMPLPCRTTGPGTHSPRAHARSMPPRPARTTEPEPARHHSLLALAAASRALRPSPRPRCARARFPFGFILPSLVGVAGPEPANHVLRNCNRVVQRRFLFSHKKIAMNFLLGQKS